MFLITDTIILIADFKFVELYTSIKQYETRKLSNKNTVDGYVITSTFILMIIIY